MKATIDPGEFRDAAVWVAKHAASSSATPVLTGVLIEASDDGLTLTAGDADTWATARMPAVVHSIGRGRVLVAGKLLGDIAGKLPKADVEIVVEGDELTLTCGSISLVVHTMSADDYTATPDLPTALGKVDAYLLAPAVARVAVAAAKDDTLPVMRGILLQHTDDGLQLSASDKYRLARTTVPWAPADRELGSEALVPAPILSDLAKAADAVVTIYLDTAHAPGVIGVSWQRRQLITRLIAGQPVNYNRALKLHVPEVSIEVDRETLLAALERVDVVQEGGKNTPRLYLDLTPGQLELQVRTSARGRAREVLAVTYDGEPRAMQANGNYLREAVKAVGGDVLTIGLTPVKRNSALLSSAADPRHQHMAMLLQDAAAAE